MNNTTRDTEITAAIRRLEQLKSAADIPRLNASRCFFYAVADLGVNWNAKGYTEVFVDIATGEERIAAARKHGVEATGARLKMEAGFELLMMLKDYARGYLKDDEPLMTTAGIRAARLSSKKVNAALMMRVNNQISINEASHHAGIAQSNLCRSLKKVRIAQGKLFDLLRLLIKDMNQGGSDKTKARNVQTNTTSY